MEKLISNNVQQIEISGIRRFFNKVIKVPDAISLTVGQPDFKVPEEIKLAMINAIKEDKTSYTSNAGIDELREEISLYLNKKFDINYSMNEMCLTIGGSEGLLSTFTTLINPGDKILIPTPAYPAYESCVKLLGGEVVNYNLKSDFSINHEELRKIIEKDEPKVLVLSYPCNPTGAVLTKKDKYELYELIKEKDIVVITDEIYSALTFEDEYYSVAQFEDIKEKVILVSGFSKMFSMTGLRLGYVCAHEKFISSIVKVHQYNVSCAPSIVQWGALEGLRSCLPAVEDMKNELIGRRDYLYDELTSLGFQVNLPKGAFYMFPSIEKFNMDSETFCEKALNEAKVAMVPGTAFGYGGEVYIRISYCYSMEELEKAVKRLKDWIDVLKF